jgi:outer membrane lipoprotein carrier protein
LLTFLIFLVIPFVSSYSFASSHEENLSRIQKAYENIVDLKGSFSQKSILKDLDRTDLYRGVFFIKYPSKMKWVYEGKAAQEVTINNDTILIFKKDDNQAFKGKFNRTTYGQAPVVLLSGFGKIGEEFNISGEDNSLTLIPREPLSNIALIEITLNEEGFPIKSFTIKDNYSNVIEISLKDIEINTGLKDSFFEFALPDGVDIFEGISD